MIAKKFIPDIACEVQKEVGEGPGGQTGGSNHRLPVSSLFNMDVPSFNKQALC